LGSESNTETDCWTAIDGSVYDLSTWVHQHPGGWRAIVRMCGTDGTNAFMRQHGNNVDAKDILKTFYKAPLVS
jgi:cytochrome b involved in lipid metabolism